MSQLRFELVSPEKLIASSPLDMVTVPGGEGDYGVLFGHAPMITTLRPGIIEMYEHGSNVPSQKIFIDGGFAEVTSERCTVLAEEATPVNELDRASLEQEAKNISDNLTVVENEHQRSILIDKLAVVKAKLAAI